MFTAFGYLEHDSGGSGIGKVVMNKNYCVVIKLTYLKQFKACAETSKGNKKTPEKEV